MMDTGDRLAAIEKQLEKCREENRTAFELSGVGQVYGDCETGRFVRVNRAFCRMLGYTAGELLQLTIRDISHPDDRDIFFKVYPRLLTGEIAEYATVKRYYHKNGRLVWVSIHASLLPRRPGEPQLIAAVIEDVTASKMAEAAAAENAARFRAIFENSRDAIAVYHGTTHAIVNSAYARLFGFDSAEELIGTPSLALIAPSARAMIQDRIIRKLRGEDVPTFYISRGLRKDGTEFDLEIHSALFDFSGERYRIVTLRDVTERNRIDLELKNSRTELEMRVRERTRDLVRVNERLESEIRGRRELESKIRQITERERRQIGQDLHDGLGQQLVGTIYMVNTMIHDTAARDPVTAAQLENLAKNLGRALEHAREISRGLFPIELEEEGFVFAMARLAERVEQTCRVRCTFACPDDLLLPADVAIQIYRITQEALANAVKHGAATAVSVQVSVQRSEIRLVVTDNGAGIRRGARRGVGLNSMRDRARLLDGRLCVRRARNGGTAVVCAIPCDFSPARSAPAANVFPLDQSLPPGPRDTRLLEVPTQAWGRKRRESLSKAARS